MYVIATLEPAHPTATRAIQLILEGASPMPAASGRSELWWPGQTHVLDEAADTMSVLVLVGSADQNELSGHRDWNGYRAALAHEVDLAQYEEVHVAVCPIHGSQTIRFFEGAFAADLQRLRKDAQIWLYAVPGTAAQDKAGKAGWNQAWPLPF
ncbi:hypothetical protein A7A76_15650 [Lysobacter enzymogenes]|uniref:hypothetical protein n=1 Tax=Lysobacter enzymogenes TaxID=69 RepID=UPI0019D2DCD2|nr:hypothetical protein [Lysobacter enzymogenes]MBN7136175.1 hypothetical protein [Lysobacter enzymogenes]